MLEVVPANNIRQREVSYVLLALLSDNARVQIATLLRKLARELPGTIWCMPADALHITLCVIYRPINYDQDKTAMYERNRRQYEDVARTVLSGSGKIAVNFDTVEASPHAIIVRGEDDGRFGAIRSQLVERLPLPIGTNLPPDIIHSSIARYTRAGKLGEVKNAVANHEITFKEEVTEFKLVRCTLQPLLDYEVLQTYPLARPSGI